MTKFVSTISYYFVDLRYPAYTQEGGEKIVSQDKVLMDDDELTRFMNSEAGGKSLLWLNFFKQINDSTLSADGSVIANEYKGQWRVDDGDVWEGFGTIKFSDGSMYQGQTKNKMYNGKGRMTHVNGDIYQGEWKDGKANGYGVFVDTNGSMYEGQWIDDQ